MSMQYRSLSPHSITFIIIALLALSFASRDALTQALRGASTYLTSESRVSVPRSHSDAGGQTASPNPSDRGFDQEEKVRRLLAEHYEQRFGKSDEAIREALGIRGKVADFVGYNARAAQWLIAESKASDIESAFEQLRNTTQALVKMNSQARFEIRLFLDARNFEILNNGGDIFGWRMNTAGYLGWQPESGWVDATIQGVKILVQCAPK